MGDVVLVGLFFIRVRMKVSNAVLCMLNDNVFDRLVACQTIYCIVYVADIFIYKSLVHSTEVRSREDQNTEFEDIE